MTPSLATAPFKAALTAMAFAVIVSIVVGAGRTLEACMPMLAAPTTPNYRECTLARDSLLRAVDDGAAAIGDVDVISWANGLLRAGAGGPRL